MQLQVNRANALRKREMLRDSQNPAARESAPQQRADSQRTNFLSPSFIKLSFANQTNQLMTNRLHRCQRITHVRLELHSHNITLIKNGNNINAPLQIGEINHSSA